MTDSQTWGGVRPPETLFKDAETTRPATTRRRARKRSNGRTVRLSAVVALVAVVAFASWLVLHNQSNNPSPAQTVTRAPAFAVSALGLQQLQTAVGHPLYWVGAKAGFTYELTRTSNGDVYVRYLPGGVAVGAAHPYLTVGTYPMNDAYGVTAGIAKRPGSVRVPAKDGGVAFYRAARPTSVYVAFPGATDQIELYDPLAAQAHSLVSAGAVRAVAGGLVGAGAAGASAAAAVSPGVLTQLSTKLREPIFWVGAVAATTYELTQTTNGRIYVRYLPAGVAVGSHEPYLTVATYPMADGFAATEKVSKQRGTTTIALPGGGVAVFHRSRPTNIYLAFPHVNAQVELYDPSSAQARRLVATHKVRAVS